VKNITAQDIEDAMTKLEALRPEPMVERFGESSVAALNTELLSYLGEMTRDAYKILKQIGLDMKREMPPRSLFRE
jgi:hypothetical protein